MKDTSIEDTLAIVANHILEYSKQNQLDEYDTFVIWKWYHWMEKNFGKHLNEK